MAKFYTIAVLIFLVFLFSASAFKIGLNKEPLANSILEWSQKITLQENYSVHVHTKKSIVILNKEGLHHGLIAIPYDKLNSIKKFEGRIINPATGKTIRKLKLKDFQDKSYISEGSVYEDSRVKFFEINNAVFPIRLEISIETVSEGNFILPTWRPAIFPNQKVSSASLEVVYPLELGMRFKAFNIDQEPLKLQDTHIATIKWDLRDVIPLNADIKSKDIPAIKLAPEKFSMQGYQSNMNTWEGLAGWQGQLNKGRDLLPVGLKSEIKALTEPLSTQEEKVEVLYKYLQTNYRYVSIQLGIGGWMPATVEEVVNKKYGDCKGLSFLMQAMLKEVGISSNYVIVLAGNDKEDIDTTFPSNQFNHVILKVSLDNKDPVWLECTSSILPPGYLGDFTMNRHVLVVGDEGGYLDKTPAFDQPVYNHSTYETHYSLDKSGNATLKGMYEFSGFASEELFYLKSQASDRDQKKFLMENLKLPGLVISGFSLETRSQSSLPYAKLVFEGNSHQFYQITSKRILIKPPFQHIALANIPNNVMLLEEKISVEALHLLHPESLLNDILEEQEHYILQINYKAEDQLLTIYRRLEIKFDEDSGEDYKLSTLKYLNEIGQQALLFMKPND